MIFLTSTKVEKVCTPVVSPSQLEGTCLSAMSKSLKMAIELSRVKSGEQKSHTSIEISQNPISARCGACGAARSCRGGRVGFEGRAESGRTPPDASPLLGVDSGLYRPSFIRVRRSCIDLHG